MKKIILSLFSVLTLMACAPEPVTIVEKNNFSGTWVLNDKDINFGGVMQISNCNDKQCDFKIESWYDQHLCDINGIMEFSDKDTAHYQTKGYRFNRDSGKEEYPLVGINIVRVSDDTINIQFLNYDSKSTFCGMSATVEGVWSKISMH